MSNPKYQVEDSISFVCRRTTLLTPDALEECQETIKCSNFHHYMIIKRPRVLLEAIEKQENAILYHFMIADKKETVSIELDEDGKKHEFEFSVYENGSAFQIKENGLIISEGKATILYNILQQHNRNTDAIGLDCEILYIGQSFGVSENKNAVDRLQNHSTLQKILSDSISRNENDDILLLLLEFDLNAVYVSLLGHCTKDADIGFDESIEKHNERLHNPISDKQKVTLIEASMISWFQPKYNKEYKSFPKEGQSSYDEAYIQDILCVCFEINSHDTWVKLYSETQTSQFFHITPIPLFKQSVRPNVFDVNSWPPANPLSSRKIDTPAE